MPEKIKCKDCQYWVEGKRLTGTCFNEECRGWPRTFRFASCSLGSPKREVEDFENGLDERVGRA
jgi:hypothetical protein